MTSIPPPYSSRDHGQVQAVPPATASTSTAASPPQSHEFSETTSICLEWKLTGLKAMYESTRGEQKSKCIKSAVFGDADNLWEVLWYPNAGTSTQTAGDHVSLYLSCVPTAQERESCIQNKWVRKGLWWFKFEIRPISINDSNRPGSNAINTNRSNFREEPIASKDASDHTFAVKTANWGWQAFSKRDLLFQNSQVLQSDSFLIICTIQSQSQPPAGIWLGIGLQPTNPNSNIGRLANGTSTSGGGLSSWSTLDGSAGGVAGGTAAGGGVKRVVPKDLVSSVGSLLDDPLYSDIEFVIPAKRGSGAPPRKIYASKKILKRCDYFRAMFHGGFKEVEGVYEEDESDDDMSIFTDSDMDEESNELLNSFQGDKSISSENQDSRIGLSPERDLHLTTTTSRNSSIRRPSISADTRSIIREDHSENDTSTSSSSDFVTPQANNSNNSNKHNENLIEIGDVTLESEDGTKQSQPSSSQTKKGKEENGINESKSTPNSKQSKNVNRNKQPKEPKIIGPKKTRVVIRDAAWSTWWAVLYWIYTDIIYFAPLTSSFEHQILRKPSVGTTNNNSANSSLLTADPLTPKTRTEWIHRWMIEHNIDSPPPPSFQKLKNNNNSILTDDEYDEDEDEDDEDEDEYEDDDEDDLIVGPKPVSAKAVYRLADKLDLPALKLRSFQHICGGLTSGNVPAEVFSRFSSTYEDVRKVQVAFFLKHWSEIKKSETMTQIWTQIRNGKHVGFEEVWPLIVGQLDFRPAT